MSVESTRWKKWRMDISKKKESMSMTKNYKGGMPTSKRYFSAWKGLYLLRMKIKFVLPSKWIHAQCNICFLAPWQDVISKIAHLHTSADEIMRFVLLLQFYSCNLLGIISWVLKDCLLLWADLEFVKKFTRPNFQAKTRKWRLFLPAINSENASLSVI